MVLEALVETWTLYSVGSFAIFLRVFTRTWMVGLRGYHIDDYLIWFCWICYTIMTVAADIVGQTGDLSNLTAEQRLSLTPSEATMRQEGTKWFMVGWYTYVGLIWTLKINMLFLYRRVAGSVDIIRKIIYGVIIFVLASAIAIYVLLATACRPFSRLWQVYPDPGPYCFPESNVFLITILVLNLVSDMCILLIPIPIIIPLQISIDRKIGLILLFGAGIFTMVAAILRAYFVDVQQMGQTAAIWSCREDVVAIVIGQATMIRPLFTPRFWGKESFLDGSGRSSNKRTAEGERSGDGGNNSGHELATIGGRSSRRTNVFGKKNPYSITALESRLETRLETRHESEEKIIEDDTSEKQPSDVDMANIPSRSSQPWNKNGESEGIQITRTVDQESEVVPTLDKPRNVQPLTSLNPLYPATVQTKWDAV